jgi:phenylalanyl-tRNA synthetase, beta subunit, non-spirochete bacterial
MKLSYSWLSEYVDLEGLTPEEVAEKLTMGAFEVEDIEKAGPDLTGPVVAGEIIEINPHPNADKIRLTKVKVKASDQPLDIVCGAGNIEVGQRIPVALPGAVVVNRKTGEKLEIVKSEIRGVPSNGMLCSPPELGITDGDTEGILILARPGEDSLDAIELGTDIIKHMSLQREYVLNVAPRSNRGDALCVLGLAREVAALTGRALKSPASSAEEAAKVSGEDGQHNGDSKEFATSIESAEDCQFFSIRILKNVKVGPSPAWMVRRLESVGVRSVNNVVDITNYVMLEYGQPLHAYDLALIAGPSLNVRRAKGHEKLVFIDGKERQLNEEVLAITDDEKVVGVAGIMGGKGSEITDDTTSIALEAASFDQARVRRGSRLLGLSSDSSTRFERGVDVETVKKASDRAAYLIEKYAAGTSAVQREKFYFSGNAVSNPVSIDVRLNQVKRMLDCELTADDIQRFLTSLGFVVEPHSEPGKVKVAIPSFRRSDVTREIDVIEEICRMYGYNNLPDQMPQVTVCPEPPNKLVSLVSRVVTGQGFSEAWISSLRPISEYADDNQTLVKVLNPLSADHQVLRQSLLPGLIDAVKYNQDRGRRAVWLFELGRSYIHLGGEVKETSKIAGIASGQQVSTVSIGGSKDAAGAKESPHLEMRDQVDFFRIKGVVENLLLAAGVDLSNARFVPQSIEGTPKVLHPYRSCTVAVVSQETDKSKKQKGQNEEALVELGWIGEIHPGMARRKDLRQPAYLFEIDLDALGALSGQRHFSELPSTPTVTRDLTVDVAAEQDQGAVQTTIESAGGNLLIECELVSIYQLSAEQKSLSYRLTFQDGQKTLTAEEVEQKLQKIRNTLTHRLGATFRG